MKGTGETSAERSMRCRTAALKSWASTEDWTARSMGGVRGAWRKYEDQVDPDRKLSPQMRAKRAEAARRAHMTELSRKAAIARRLKAEAKKS